MKIQKIAQSQATLVPAAHPLQELADAVSALEVGESLIVSELGRDYFARSAYYIHEQLSTILPDGVSVDVETDGARTPSSYTVTRK